MVGRQKMQTMDSNLGLIVVPTILQLNKPWYFWQLDHNPIWSKLQVTPNIFCLSPPNMVAGRSTDLWGTTWQQSDFNSKLMLIFTVRWSSGYGQAYDSSPYMAVRRQRGIWPLLDALLFLNWDCSWPNSKDLFNLRSFFYFAGSYHNCHPVSMERSGILSKQGLFQLYCLSKLIKKIVLFHNVNVTTPLFQMNDQHAEWQGKRNGKKSCHIID